jgi:plastocyanin
MRLRPLLLGGLLGAAAVVAGPGPASAAQLVVSRLDNTYTNAAQTVSLGDTVNFSNDPLVGGGGEHNVVWDDNGVKPTPPEAVDTPWTARRSFTKPGLYRYYCEEHGSRGGVGMAGKVLVRNADGSLPDVFAPRLGRVSTAVSRGDARLRFTSSEDGTGRGKVEHQVGSHFRGVGSVTFRIRRGINHLRLRTHGFSSGNYRLRFAVTDDAGNRSSAKQVRFRLAD